MILTCWWSICRLSWRGSSPKDGICVGCTGMGGSGIKVGGVGGVVLGCGYGIGCD